MKQCLNIFAVSKGYFEVSLGDALVPPDGGLPQSHRSSLLATMQQMSCLVQSPGEGVWQVSVLHQWTLCAPTQQSKTCVLIKQEFSVTALKNLKAFLEILLTYLISITVFVSDTNTVMQWTPAIRTKMGYATEQWIHVLSAIIRDVNVRIRIYISQHMDNLEAECPPHNTVFIKTPVQSIYVPCLRKIRKRRYIIICMDWRENIVIYNSSRQH